MIKLKEEEQEERIIDLTGPQGNAFYLMDVAVDFYKQMNKTKKEESELLERMKSSDYTNLIKSIHDEFGDLVTIQTNDKNLIKEIRNE